VVVHRENSEHDENGERHKGLYWFRPPESKTLRPVCGGIRCELGSPLEWSSRPPYMASELGLPFKVDGPSSGRLQIRKGSFRDYREDPAIHGPTGGAEPRSRQESCATSQEGLPESR
jgi:hypothetical protein